MLRFREVKYANSFRSALFFCLYFSTVLFFCLTIHNVFFPIHAFFYGINADLSPRASSTCEACTIKAKARFKAIWRRWYGYDRQPTKDLMRERERESEGGRKRAKNNCRSPCCGFGVAAPNVLKGPRNQLLGFFDTKM